MYDVNFSVQYFIDKFESIPEELWCVGSYADSYNKFCALGHCGERGDSTKESIALSRMFNFEAAMINDGDNFQYQQKTPKQRILAALYDIRDKELSEANVNAAKEIIEVEKIENNERVPLCSVC